MRPEHLHSACLVLLAILVGRIGWSGHVLLLPVAIAFPVLWSVARDRVTAGLVSAGYFLAASRGLPEGVAIYFQSDLWPGLLLWFCASVSFVGVHTALWTRHRRARPLHYLAAATALAVPPFGITGWAHPVTAAGVLFPEWGWWGLGAMTAGLMGLVSPLRPAVAMILAGFWLWSAATWTGAGLANGWQGVDLKRGSSLGREATLKPQQDLIATVLSQASGETSVIVLPESALGSWTPTVERLWTRSLAGTPVTVVAGATVFSPDGYDNVLVAVSAAGGRILYRERMPVPGSMWQPWRTFLGDSGGASADFFTNPVIDLNGQRISALICYEQLLVWPVLSSMLYQPDILVAVGNGWWTAGTSIVAIQRASTEAWARLFSTPLVLSFNT